MAAGIAVSCGGSDQTPPEHVERERAQDPILRIGSTWQSRLAEDGFRNPPSALALFKNQVVDTLKLGHGERRARETFEILEEMKTRDGRVFRCRASTAVDVDVLYGWRGEAPGIEVRRPGAVATRTCDPPDFPEPSFSIPAASARFVLKNDTLSPIAPAGERRQFVPEQ